MHPDTIPAGAQAPLARRAGSAADWARAIWVESQRRGWPSLLRFFAWFQVMNRLKQAGFATHWKGEA